LLRLIARSGWPTGKRRLRIANAASFFGIASVARHHFAESKHQACRYATPRAAANILKDAKEGNENWCEWIYSCYRRDPQPAVERAIRNRHHHEGYMASYELALQIVRRELGTGEGPTFASWF